MIADGFREQSLCVRQSKDLFGKSVKLGFAQLFRLRCDTLDGCATGDEPVRPLAPISFFIVGGSVFKALNFVLFLRKLPLLLVFLTYLPRSRAPTAESRNLGRQLIRLMRRGSFFRR